MGDIGDIGNYTATVSFPSWTGDPQSEWSAAPFQHHAAGLGGRIVGLPGHRASGNMGRMLSGNCMELVDPASHARPD